MISESLKRAQKVYRDSPKGKAVRKKWDKSNRQERTVYHRQWVKDNPEKIKVYEEKRGRNYCSWRDKLKQLQEEYNQLYGKIPINS